jgi:thioredoxin 1
VAEVLNDETFAAAVKESPLPVLVDFFKDGCTPCRRVAPLLSQAEQRYGDKLRFVRVNLAHSPKLVAQYDIQAAPTLVLLKDGQELARHRGVIDRAGLEAFLGNLDRQEEHP